MSIIGIMNSSKKLLNLIGILAIGSLSFQEVTAIDDLDDTLKQAIFLVKLLKTDFARVLRVNNDVANSTEVDDTNSTCSLPSEDFNSTMAMNETEVTVSGASSKNVVLTTTLTPASPPPSPSPSPPASQPASPPASLPPAPPDSSPPALPVSPPASPPPSPPISAPPSQPNMLPGAPMMMPYASWPPMSMGYLPSAPGLRSFPDENYRFPYRHSRRRMMPDYYYYDSPFKSGGQFRRFNNYPTADLGNTATSQAQTTTSLPSVTSEATTLHVEESKASTTSLPTTKGQPSMSILPATNTTNQSLLATVDSTNQSILSTVKSTKQSILPKTKESNLPKIKPSTLKTKPSKRVRQKKRVPKPKARTTKSYKRNKKPLRISHNHLRHGTTDSADTSDKADTADTADITETDDSVDTATTDTNATHEAEMSQVSILLKQELEHTEVPEEKLLFKNKTKKIDTKDSTATSTTTRRIKATTMKIFLKGSSRMPIPFPENNGFCYFHPESSLCGAH